MSWMILSAPAASMCVSVALALLYVHLYIQERKDAMRLWAIGWALLALRFVPQMTAQAGGGTPILQMFETLLWLWGGLLLVAGVQRFWRRTLPAWGLPVAWGVSAWTLISRWTPLFEPLVSIPPVLLLLVAHIGVALTVLRSDLVRGMGRYLAGGGLLAWGLYKVYYPFRYLYPEPDALAYLLYMLLGLLVGSGLLLAYLDYVRRRMNAGERRLRMLFDNVADAIYVFDLDGQILDANNMACEMLGYCRDELLSMKVYDVISPEYVARARERVGRFHEVDEGYYQSYHRRRDGTDVPIEIHSRRVEYGGAPAVFSIVRDISARVAAERALRDEEERAQQYLDIAGVIILALDRAGNIVLLNRQGHAVLGCEREAVIGLNWCDHFVPEREREMVRARLTHLFETGTVVDHEVENLVLTRQGEERIIAWRNVALRDEAGEVTGLLSSGEDVTERRQAEQALRESEQRFRTLVDSIGDLVFTLDTEQRHVEIYGRWQGRNAAMAERMIG